MCCILCLAGSSMSFYVFKPTTWVSDVIFCPATWTYNAIFLPAAWVFWWTWSTTRASRGVSPRPPKFSEPAAGLLKTHQNFRAPNKYLFKITNTYLWRLWRTFLIKKLLCFLKTFHRAPWHQVQRLKNPVRTNLATCCNAWPRKYQH